MIKNSVGWETFTGMALEKAPVPLRVPVVFVVQSMMGVVRLVVVSKV